MACEHDGNCFSGCCSLFVSGDQKRCMPLVGGDMCPIAIDVVEKFKIVSDEDLPVVHEEALPVHHEVPVAVPVVHEPELVHEEYDSPLHYVDHKEPAPVEEEHEKIVEADHDIDHEVVTPAVIEDHPIVEKGEHHEVPHIVEEVIPEVEYTPVHEEVPVHEYVPDLDYEDDYDHVIPMKREHHVVPTEDDFYSVKEGFDGYAALDEEDYYGDDYDHVIPVKGEHHDTAHLSPHAEDVHYMPKAMWRPEFSGHEYDDLPHHYEHADDISEDLIEDIEKKDAEKKKGKLTPKTPEKDDPRLKIPQGKAQPTHDHVIVPKEPVPTAEHKPAYGQAYEHEKKKALKGDKESIGLAPK